MNRNRPCHIRIMRALIPAVLAILTLSCNSSEGWETEPESLSGAAVSGFSLKANASVLNNLDSVYFSIDLVEGKIFNATPLPCGTKVDALAVSISGDACSVVQLTGTNGAVVDYLATPDEPVDFSGDGDVILRMVSANGLTERKYRVTLNVAKESLDSLYWDKLQGGRIPGVASTSRAKTVKVASDKALMLSRNSSGVLSIRAFTPDAGTGGGVWSSDAVTPAFDMNTGLNPGQLIDIESFTATEDGTLYLLDINGYLHRSTDSGINFKMLESGWKSITAAYGNAVLGVKTGANGLEYAAWPADAVSFGSKSVAADFPLSGVSQAAVFSTKWASADQIVITGGRISGDGLTGSTWAFDGTRWAKISQQLPAGAGYSLVEYTVAQTDSTNWSIKQKQVLLAFGGLNNVADKTVWLSADMGVNWRKAPKDLQLPTYVPFATGASLLVFDKEMTADGATPLAVKPITQWQCPYLYLFGGYDATGAMYTDYWSGVVNHLKLKPLQ